MTDLREAMDAAIRAGYEAGYAGRSPDLPAEFCVYDVQWRRGYERGAAERRESDTAAEIASLRAEVERLRKENQTLSDMSQGKDDAIAELRHDLETLRADLDSQTFREELDTPKEPPDAQVRPR